MIKCPLTGSTNIKIIYEQKSVPLIQNKLYPLKEDAIKAPCIDVTLAQSLDNGFVFSGNFDETIIDYDQHYNNEQSNSPVFRKHMENVIKIMEENNALNGKVIEIGCGKAYFMEMLLEKGIDVIGFDPTYEGDSPKVRKEFFTEEHSDIGAEFIILRHTMEHIASPHEFIKTIAAANNHKGKIYIEVPAFEWIVANNATEDIFYEHCNYFTLPTLQMLFTKSVGGHFFNGQYIYIIADLKDVKDTLEIKAVEPYDIKFHEKLAQYGELIEKLHHTAIWGAGAKGSTFLNILDKDGGKIQCVVDINPSKQHKYLGGTGHRVIKPEELRANNIENVIVMNVNYIDEIKAVTESLKINLVTL